MLTYVPGTLTVTSTQVPGYLETLSYLHDLRSEDGGLDTVDEDERLEAKPSLLKIRNEGIRLPAGVP